MSRVWKLPCPKVEQVVFSDMWGFMLIIWKRF